MGDIKQQVTTSIATIFTTALDSLTQQTRIASGSGTGDIDNRTNLDHFGDFELLLTGITAPGAIGDPLATLWMFPSVDGTNFPTGATSSQDGESRYLVGTFTAETTGTTQRMVLTGIPLPPHKLRFVLLNEDSTAYGSTSNSLKMQASRFQAA